MELEFDLLPDIPSDVEVVAVEGPQSADGLVEDAGLELSFVLKMDEEIEHALRWEVGQILVRVMARELENPSEVGLARALCETFELDEAGEVLIPRGRSDRVIFFS